MPGSDDRWAWRPLPRPDADLRLICFPFAGGGPSVFHGWAQALPPQVELIAVRLPGRQSRLAEAPFSDWPGLLASLCPVISGWSDRAFALFGHSLGAMIAYEAARTLAASGAALPSRLLLAGCRAPGERQRVPLIHRLPDDEFVAALPAATELPPEVLADRRARELLLPAMRADLTLAETWPPAAPVRLGLPATVFAARDDGYAPAESVHGWTRYTDPCSIHLLNGTHFFINTPDGAFLRLLTDVLTAVPRPAGR